MTTPTLESLAQESALFQLRTLPRLQALEESVKSINARAEDATTQIKAAANAVADALHELQGKIKTLEDARQAQRSLNQTFAIKAEKPVDSIQAKPIIKKWFWEK